MIKINNKEYKCKEFMYHRLENTEHLHIKINGELQDKENNLFIEYKGVNIKGIKILPRVSHYHTEFIVYILQDGDSEG